MNKETSLYLDLVRFVSALLVLFAHFSMPRFSDAVLADLYPLGHGAVIVFFVLSGYVIAFVADTKERNLCSFAISRFARLYSVLVPALLLVPLLDALGQSVNALVYLDQTRSSYFLGRFLAHLLFVQEFWWGSVRYFSDAPLWSLGFEFWYYLLFAVAVYLNGRKRLLLLLAGCLLAGPKILVLMPPWLLGVALYHFHRDRQLSPLSARVCFLGSLILLPALFPYYRAIDSALDALLPWLTYERFGNAEGFITDYLTAALVGLNILGIPYLRWDLFRRGLTALERPIRYLANGSFSLYVFHFPLLLFWAAIRQHNPENFTDRAILLVLTLVSCLLLAEITEKRKYLWKRGLTWLSRIRAGRLPCPQTSGD
ncbi:MAG: acyltransferase [Gammaproteobacteria bacterium]|nr:acyltransferase [Gammaproteobacteria bacterium]MBU1656338.1 acyltransferase [Gammaproteobacteria bacterium]MBU1959903.1 acyltransferase [Gammaproteobacteria bacterium]